MKIKRLKIENFRGISDVDIALEEKSAIFYGVNGMGKSTILDACNILFSRILREASGDSQTDVLSITDRDLKIGAKEAKITVWFQIGEKEFHYYRFRTADGANRHNLALLNNAADYIREQYIGDYAEGDIEDSEEAENVQGHILENEENMPVYVSYGVNRYNESLRKVRRRYTGAAGKLDAWRDEIFGGTINFRSFFEWFRSRQEYENSMRVENPDAKDTQLEAVKTAILTALGEEFSMIRVKITEDDAQLVVTKKGGELTFYQLSEGEKSIIAFVGDLTRRLAIANPKREDPLLGEGIVLIDEIDLHLHPYWQARIFPVLQGVFRNIQFIVSTHAPKVLESVGEDVRLIRLQEKDDTIQAEEMPSMQGWDVNTILEDYMDTCAYNERTAKLIHDLKQCIKQKNMDQAELLVNQLADMTDEQNPEVVKGRILIARGR